MMLVLLVLCSGFFHCTLANRLRVFDDNIQQNREAALDYCKTQHMSLVTLYDEGDASFTKSFMVKHFAFFFWLGLHQHKHNISSWSNNETVTFNLSNVTQSDRDDQTCEAIENGSWINKNCSEKLAFMCYNGNIRDNNYTLIKSEKNWCQARQFCKRNYTDLVSISSDDQNREVINQGQGSAFWIGLIHDRWKWEDNGCSTYRNWVSGGQGGNVTMQCCGTNTIRKSETYQGKHTICSKGKVRIIRVHDPLPWEEAFDYCNSNHTGLLSIEDKDDQYAVEQWLEHTEHKSDHFWIGLRQSRVFGFWIWMSGRMVSDSNWKDGTQPKQPLSYQCGAISGHTHEWTDKNCLLPLPFLCEEEIPFMNP